MLKELFERFAHMDLTTWLSMIAVALSATLVRILVEINNFNLKEFIIGSILALFLAYMTMLYCLDNEMSERMTALTVGFVTYQATNILTGIGRLGAAFAKDPIALFSKIKGAVKK